jgi:hypothetical protein
MRANAWFAQHALAYCLKLRLCGMNIGHFVTHMMLATLWVLFKERRDGGIAGEWLNQLNLRAVHRSIRAGRINKADFHPLIRQVKRRMNFRRAHNVTVKDDAILDGGCCDTDMV